MHPSQIIENFHLSSVRKEDFCSNVYRFARLAIQTGGDTNAQANVQIGVTFGKRKIRNALVQSMMSAQVVWMRKTVAEG